MLLQVDSNIHCEIRRGVNDRFPFVDEEVHRGEFGVIPTEYKPVLTKKEEEEEEEEEDYFDDVLNRDGFDV